MLHCSFLNKHITKFDVDPQNYNTISRRQPTADAVEPLSDLIQEKYPSTQNYPCPGSIKLSIWKFFASEQEVNEFMIINDNSGIRKFIAKKIGEYPKGASRLLLIDLLYSLRKFTDKMSFTEEQIASLFAIFQLTHEFFTSSIYISAETVFEHFKDLIIVHSISFFPDYQEVFHSYEITPKIVEFFGKLYLRHLPLIRLLSLPNFSYNVSYELPQELPISKTKKGKKDKKSKSLKPKKKKK